MAINFHSIFLQLSRQKCKLGHMIIIRNASDASNVQRSGPLNGIRILDLTRILAGPFCTMVLGDLGAEVIKVEKPGGGDETRKWGPPFKGEESCYFLSVNRNKKSIIVDMKHPDGRNIIKKLAISSDVLVENFVPGKLGKMGLGYESLKEVAPHLIYCSITGYGPTGPYKDRAGYDVIAASIGGLVHITGPGNGDPCKVGVAITDLATGLYAHGAIMAALLERNRTGMGQKIDCDLLSTQVSLLINVGSNYLNGGMDARRLGTAHESIVPYQAFRTADGYLTVGAGSNEHFTILCKLLNMEYLLVDPRYKSNEDRVSNRTTLLSLLSAKFQERPTSHWLKVFENCGIPYGPINNIEQVFKDPQVQHRKMLIEMIHTTAGKIRLPGPAVQYGLSNNSAYLPPPTLGQHTSQVLSSILHLPEDKIRSLQEQGIIA